MCCMHYRLLCRGKQCQNYVVLLLSLNSEFPADNKANPVEDEMWGKWVAVTGVSEVLQVV